MRDAKDIALLHQPLTRPRAARGSAYSTRRLQTLSRLVAPVTPLLHLRPPAAFLRLGCWPAKLHFSSQAFQDRSCSHPSRLSFYLCFTGSTCGTEFLCRPRANATSVGAMCPPRLSSFREELGVVDPSVLSPEYRWFPWSLTIL